MVDTFTKYHQIVMYQFNVVIFDTSVFLHDVAHWFERLGVEMNLNGSMFRDIITCQFKWWHRLGFLPDPMIPPSARLVYAMDAKRTYPSGVYGYWRHDELSRVPKKKRKRNPETKELEVDYVSYKSGRKNYNPEDLHSPDREVQKKAWLIHNETKVFQAVRRLWYQFAQEQNLEVYEVAGYEADDCAAAFTVLNPESKVLLCTIDQDWIGLVSENVSWYDVKGYQRPRLITSDTLLEWAGNKGYTDLQTASDIWKIKAAEGDKSDSLPADTDIRYISLLSPPEEHRLWIDNRLVINNRQPEKIVDYRGVEKHLLKSSVQKDGLPPCQLGTFYGNIREERKATEQSELQPTF